jgi:hypothetical protein
MNRDRGPGAVIGDQAFIARENADARHPAAVRVERDHFLNTPVVHIDAIPARRARKQDLAANAIRFGAEVQRLPIA